MQNARNNPDSEENQQATRDNARYIGGLKLAANTAQRKKSYDKTNHGNRVTGVDTKHNAPTAGTMAN